MTKSVIKRSLITPCLCFEHEAEEAAKFYISIFKNSKITNINHYGKITAQATGISEGSILAVTFELEGQEFIAINGPTFKFTEAISLMVYCKNQKEIDYYWSRLSKGGDKKSQMCGWLKDKFGISWQVVPTSMIRMMKSKHTAKFDKALAALNTMKKINLKTLEKAYKG
jgi:predicted 3-demethylubiquinone-9 3-methyltransferase (glyoxalase superfamily)